MFQLLFVLFILCGQPAPQEEVFDPALQSVPVFVEPLPDPPASLPDPQVQQVVEEADALQQRAESLDILVQKSRAKLERRVQ
jgi:hypothetical protein